MFVTGCHRSGTSLVATLLRALLDQDQDRSGELPPAPDNPRGFQESQSLNKLNNQLLSLAGCRWDYPPVVLPDWSSQPYFKLLFDARSDFSDLSLHGRWVEKNPRLCITASAMEHLLLKRVPFVVIVRSPEVVATSLFRRNGLSLQHGLLIWFLYNFHLASVLKPTDFLLSYESLLHGNSGESLDRLFGFLECFEMDPEVAGMDRAKSYIDASLNRSSDVMAVFSSQSNLFAQNCRECYEACMAGGGSIEQFKNSFSVFSRPMLDQLPKYGHWSWGELSGLS